MKLLPDGAGYRAAFAARRDAGALPDFTFGFPLLTITVDSVSLNDEAIESAIDDLVKTAGSLVPLIDPDSLGLARVVLTRAREQRAEWLTDLARWWTEHLIGRRNPRIQDIDWAIVAQAPPAAGGPHHDDQAKSETPNTD